MRCGSMRTESAACNAMQCTHGHLPSCVVGVAVQLDCPVATPLATRDLLARREGCFVFAFGGSSQHLTFAAAASARQRCSSICCAHALPPPRSHHASQSRACEAEERRGPVQRDSLSVQLGDRVQLSHQHQGLDKDCHRILRLQRQYVGCALSLPCCVTSAERADEH